MIKILSKKQRGSALILSRGFTLIELLIVIAIIGILASIVLVSMGGARSKARDAQRQSDTRQVVTAQEMYYGDNGSYFATGTTAAATSTLVEVTGYLDELSTPSAAGEYIWNDNAFTPGTGCTAGEFFCACAQMENEGSCTNVKFFCASEKGTKEICDTLPTYADANDCTCW